MDRKLHKPAFADRRGIGRRFYLHFTPHFLLRTRTGDIVLSPSLSAFPLDLTRDNFPLSHLRNSRQKWPRQRVQSCVARSLTPPYRVYSAPRTGENKAIRSSAIVLSAVHFLYTPVLIHTTPRYVCGWGGVHVRIFTFLYHILYPSIHRTLSVHARLPHPSPTLRHPRCRLVAFSFQTVSRFRPVTQHQRIFGTRSNLPRDPSRLHLPISLGSGPASFVCRLSTLPVYHAAGRPSLFDPDDSILQTRLPFCSNDSSTHSLCRFHRNSITVSSFAEYNVCLDKLAPLLQHLRLTLLYVHVTGEPRLILLQRVGQHCKPFGDDRLDHRL